jgi:hypothetical protein
VLYAMFLCTYVAALPHVAHCELPSAIADSTLVIFENEKKCDQVAVQRNAVWRDPPGARMWTRYVCLERAPPQQPLQ